MKAPSSFAQYTGLIPSRSRTNVSVRSLRVPDRDSEHPDQPTHGCTDAVSCNRFKDDFCVGVASKVLTGGFQFFPDLDVTIDFAVVTDDKPSIGRVHGLMPGR